MQLLVARILTCTHTHTHTTHIYIIIYTHTYVHHRYTHYYAVHILTHPHTHTYTHVYTHTYTHTPHTHTPHHTRTHTHTHPLTHTHTQRREGWGRLGGGSKRHREKTHKTTALPASCWRSLQEHVLQQAGASGGSVSTSCQPYPPNTTTQAGGREGGRGAEP